MLDPHPNFRCIVMRGSRITLLIRGGRITLMFFLQVQIHFSQTIVLVSKCFVLMAVLESGPRNYLSIDTCYF